MHHHMLPLTLDEGALTREARKRYVDWGGGARSEGINLSADAIRERLASNGPDPHGEKLLERMARAGIDITILCVVDNADLGLSDEEMLGQNRACARIALDSRGKILALAGVDPRRTTAPELFRRCVEEYGMKGLKWHPDAGYYPNGKEAYAVLEVAERLGTPLLTHTGPLPMAANRAERRRASFAQPIYLDDVTQDFPGLKVIAAHMGRFAWREWAQLAQFRPTLYGDLAMWQIFAVASYARFCRDLRDILDIAGVDSVLFGSDGPGFTALIPNEQFIGILRDLPRKAPSGIRFSDEEIDAILGWNARKAFGLEKQKDGTRREALEMQ
jgi:predicted TIM-barrel fold metal-dependent hydrolase